MQSQPASIAWAITSTGHLIIVEFTLNTLFDELDVLLYIFDINIVWDMRIYFNFGLINVSSM